mgnify:CR=1 FL=1
MAFNYFLIGLCGIYICYYLIMLVWDIIKMNKDKNDESQGKDVDISDAVANYKPRVASEVMQKESEEVMAEMEKMKSAENYNESEEPFNDEEEFPYNMNSADMFISSADENDEPESGGTLNIQYEPVESVKDEYPDVEMNGGYFATNIKGLVDEMTDSESLFAHIKWSAAG